MHNGSTPSCTAHKKRTDPPEPCPNPRVTGTTVCRMHGGANTAVRAAGRQRAALVAAEGEIAQLMNEVDLPEQHPIDGLLEVVRVSGAMMRLLTIKVGQLDHKPGGVDLAVSPEGDLLETQAHGFWMPGAYRNEMVAHTYVQLLGTWSERYARACKLALDANIDERLVRNAEQTSETMFKAIGEALDAAELSPAQRDTMIASLASSLRKYAPLELQG
jgi:hypothetical protein